MNVGLLRSKVLTRLPIKEVLQVNGGAMKVARTAAAMLAVAGGALGSIVAVQTSAQAAGCVAVASQLSSRVAHASCKSGSGDVRVKIKCIRPTESTYVTYGPWVYSDSIGDTSNATCVSSADAIVSYSAEKR
jgi:hypothetical protein